MILFSAFAISNACLADNPKMVDIIMEENDRFEGNKNTVTDSTNFKYKLIAYIYVSPAIC